jgi:hypothetical protein
MMNGGIVPPNRQPGPCAAQDEAIAARSPVSHTASPRRGRACGKVSMERRSFLLNLPPQPSDRRLAAGAVVVSLLIFVATAPFARTQLPAVWAFVPSYQSALAITT